MKKLFYYIITDVFVADLKLVDKSFCVKRCLFARQEIPSEGKKRLGEYRDNGITHKNASICFTFFIANIVHFTVCNCSHKNCINGEKRAKGKTKTRFSSCTSSFFLCCLPLCNSFFKICYSFVSLMNRNLGGMKNLLQLGREEVRIKLKQNNFNLSLNGRVVFSLGQKVKNDYGIMFG